MALHLSTYLSRSPTALLSRIKSLKNQYANHGLTLLFALSANVPDSLDLERAVSSLTRFEATRTIGCLAGRLGNTNINGTNIANDALSLAVAVFDSKKVVPFRSTIPGREETQVGRWHAFRRKNDPGGEEYQLSAGSSWEDVWNGAKGIPLPKELQILDPSDNYTLLYLSDLKPEGLLDSFQSLPDINKLGLLTSSTPFITGRPVTLFRDLEIFSSGAVGIALKGDATHPPPHLEAEFLQVRKLGAPMTVTQTEGNMVNALNNDNPTRLLLSAIERSGLQAHVPGSFKEEEQFSLGVLSSSGKIDRVYRITAGDPSRGSLSIDSPNAPSVGTVVQFLHRPISAVPTFSVPCPSQTLCFLTVSDEPHPQSNPPAEDFEMVLDGTFLAASENGFIVDRPSQSRESVKCSLAGSLGTLRWTSVQHRI